MKIDNPLPATPPVIAPVVVNLAIDFDGTVSCNGTAKEDRQPEMHITVDKFAKYDKVAQTLADLQSRGLKKIGFVNNNLF